MNPPRKSAYLTDHWTTKDDLHFSDFRTALQNILHNADTPLTVGIFGPWGSGKTSLLRMLKDDLDKPGNPFIRTVWFTAWKYDRHEALWRAFILRAIDGLFPKMDGERIPTKDVKNQKQQAKVARLEKILGSLYRVVEWETKGGWDLDVIETVKEGIKLPPWLALRLAGLGDVAKDFGINPELAKLIKRESEEYRMEQLVSMEQFEKTFRDALQLILGETGRLIVFVDDLDRCLPEKAVEVLEAIKLFLHVPQTVFVLGMDREVVERGVESHYRSFFHGQMEDRTELPINGAVYLQKLVQIPFHLPPIGVEDVDGYIQSLEKDQERETHLSEITRQVFAKGVFPNPRQVKRALNIFRLLKAVAEAREKRGDLAAEMIAWPLLAKTVLIQSQWPRLYTLWRQFPTFVQTLEEEYRRQPTLEEELIRGTLQRAARQETPPSTEPLPEERPAPPQARDGGLLAPYLEERQKYTLLAQMLTFPDDPGAGRERARFAGLNREEMNAYVSLAGTVESVEAAAEPVEAPGDLLSEFLSGERVLVNEALSRLQSQEPESDGPLRQALQREIKRVMQDSAVTPPQRANAGDALDRLGWLPDDLYRFVPIPSAPFAIAKFPVTNLQYQRFVEADDFADRALWQGFLKFAEPEKDYERLGPWGDEGWKWLENLPDYRSRDTVGMLYPQYWQESEYGIARRGVPVVGVSWYEANAYCQWLQRHWEDLEESRANPGLKPALVRLPVEKEWAAAAGGEANDRYPWDKPGETTRDEAALARANFDKSGIDRTTPVGMYPLGESHPHGLVDMGGNVWEWQANYRDSDHDVLALRGGSWRRSLARVRVSARSRRRSPYSSSYSRGFRVMLVPSMPLRETPD